MGLGFAAAGAFCLGMSIDGRRQPLSVRIAHHSRPPTLYSTDFTGTRNVAMGVVVATCTTPQTLIPDARTFPKAHVKRGKLVTYGVRFRSTSPAITLTGLRVEISLPPCVSIISTGTSPLPYRRNKASAAGVVRGRVVIWQNVTINPKKARAFRVRMRVAREAPSGTVLSFASTLYQTNASPGGSPYCPMQIQNTTVRTQCVSLR